MQKGANYKAEVTDYDGHQHHVWFTPAQLPPPSRCCAWNGTWKQSFVLKSRAVVVVDHFSA